MSPWIQGKTLSKQDIDVDEQFEFEHQKKKVIKQINEKNCKCDEETSRYSLKTRDAKDEMLVQLVSLHVCP